MKKVLVLAVLMTIIASCTAEDRMLWNEVQRERSERGVECRYNKRGGVDNCRYMD